MPPDDSSRSSTYFPKIWGNTGAAHRTLAIVAWLVSGCRTVPGPERAHDIHIHFPEGCAPPQDGPKAAVDLEALGDFDPSEHTHEIVTESSGSHSLAIPADTRVVALTGGDGLRRFVGLGLPDVGGDFDAPLFPRGEACPLWDGATGYPGTNGGEAVGYSPDAQVLLVAGGEGDTRVAAGGLIVDVRSARASPLGAEEGPPTRRTGATATAWGPGFLVAGGRDPVEGGIALASADVFDATARRFEPDRIVLGTARAHHAAVTLASGEVLLAGGIDQDGRALRTLEAVSPSSRRYRVSGLADLLTPRVDPVLVRLSDDRLLVGGGTDAYGGSASPVESLEWLSPDASRVEASLPSLGARTLGRAFVAMPGGGALAVGGCELSAAGETPPCTDRCALGAGCPSHQVHWIAPDETAELLADPLDADAPTPQVARASDGRPLLVASRAGAPVLLTFDPWARRFADSDELPAPAAAGARVLGIDAGLFGWLSIDGGLAVLSAVRQGTRGPYASAVAPLLLRDTAGVSLDRAAPEALDPQTSEVLLDHGGARLFVTDTTYADVHVEADVREGPAPIFRLGTRDYGGADCPWPAPVPSAPFSADLDREGSTVRLTLGTKHRDCDGPSGRVTLAVTSPGDRVRLRALTVRRSPP